MKCVAILGALVALTVSTYAYSTAYDNIDLEPDNVEVLLKYNNCFIGKTSCDEQAQDFKSKMAEVIREACAQCNTVQKQKVKQFLDGLKEKLPVEYAELKNKFDPEDKLFVALEAALAKA